MRSTVRLWPLPALWKPRSAVSVELHHIDQVKLHEPPFYCVSMGNMRVAIEKMDFVHDIKMYGYDPQLYRPQIQQLVALALIQNLGLESVLNGMVDHIFEDSEKRSWQTK